MARRGSSPSRGSSAFGRGRSPSPTARRAAPPPPPRPAATQKAVAPTPAPATQVAPAQMAAPGGGMMANIATTAAGVAIGHTMGHALTGALGMNGGHQPEPAPADQTAPAMQQQQPQHYGQPLAGQDPCKFELEQFIQCAQSQSSDLSLCDGFNAVLRECKTRYGGGQQMYQ